MSAFTKEHNNIIETLISIFTIDKGDLKVLLIKNKVDPYKGYWILPGAPLKNEETLEDNITDAVLDQTGLLKVYIEQCYTFSNLTRYPDNRVLAVSFMGLVDSTSVEFKREIRKEVESEWFKIGDIPKVGYDHEEIIRRDIDYLKKRIVNINFLKNLFPCDFTLPELQRVYEQIFDKSIDRRNFRKKFIGMDLIEDTGEYNTGCNGRPAKLYRFKENIKQIDLF